MTDATNPPRSAHFETRIKFDESNSRFFVEWKRLRVKPWEVLLDGWPAVWSRWDGALELTEARAIAWAEILLRDLERLERPA